MIKLALSLLGTFFLTMHSYANFCYTSPDTEQSIVILTIPKSGTHLLHKALGLITGEEIRAEEPQIINGKSVYFSHLWPENESVINDPNCLKIIFFRDPRDTIISQMFWVQRTKNCGGKLLPKNKIRKFLSMLAYEKICFLINLPEESGISYFCNTFAKWIDNPLVRAFRFEDLVGEAGGGSQIRQEKALQELAQCLGVELSSDEVTTIAMQLFGDTRTFRKGKIGEWKKYFNEQHKALFKRNMGDALIKLGYEQNNEW